MHIRSLKRAAIAACVAAALAAVPASADPVVTKLRVEAAGQDLDRGNSYLHDSVEYTTAKGELCGGTGASKAIAGPTALGLLVQAADFNGRLDPVRISDKYEFGPFVCEIGGFGADGYWLYKVDHVAPEVGADQFALTADDSEVLWYFVNSLTGANSGSELGLFTDDRFVKAGEPAAIRVLQFDAQGQATPAAGARLSGTGGAVTNELGDATVVFDEPGRPFVRGTRGDDIPTDGIRLCVYERSPRECRDLALERIIGTGRDDRLEAGASQSLVLGREGDDVIRTRGGARDEVRCGRGQDRAIVDRADTVGSGCERVSRK